jgi:NCS1 family nucleobase:cation symporter-1
LPAGGEQLHWRVIAGHELRQRLLGGREIPEFRLGAAKPDLILPWTAINLVDYYLIRHGNYDVQAFSDPSGGPYGRIGWIGIGAYVIGIGVEIPFMSTTWYTGPAATAMNGTDLSWLVGLIITVPLYYLLAARFVARRPAAPVPAT